MNKFVNFNNDLKLSSGVSGNSGMLSRLQHAGGGLSNTAIFGIIVAVILLSIGIYYIFYYNSSAKASYKPNSEHVMNGASNNGSTGGEAELMLFFADWCPHCKTAKPIWDDLKSQYENKTINGYTVIFTEINCTQETAEVEQMMNKYNIEGFPTIKLLKDGQIIEYDAKPTKDTLVQFLNSVL